MKKKKQLNYLSKVKNNPQRRLSYLFELSEESIVIYLLVLKLLFVSNERIKN